MILNRRYIYNKVRNSRFAGKMGDSFSRVMLSLLCGTLFSLPSIPLFAFEEASYTELDMPMDEIVVFARKRREKIQDIPASVGILSSAMIEQSAIDGLKDVATFTANFSYDEAFGRNNLQ
ncbi:hypothetical protein MNBD_ALPHA01-891, partial [hydrothermal vent metagenome]